MKLRKIYNQIREEQLLKEIGDRFEIPQGATFQIHEYEGKVKFKFLDDDYLVAIRLPIKQGNQAGMTVDFITNNDLDAKMTNKGSALKVMSYVVGSIDEWIKRYKKYYFNNDPFKLIYIKFNPKSESGEISSEFANKRDKLYRIYINQFASKYGSQVEYSSGGGITAKFNPKIIIK